MNRRYKRDSNGSYRFALLALIIVTLLLMSGKAKGQTLDSVRYEIAKNNIQHPEIVLRQAIEESGWFDCVNCSRDVNNIFGFYWRGAYIKFDTWQESVAYYARWQKRHYKGGDYYQFLKDRGYAENPKYIENLKRIKL